MSENFHFLSAWHEAKKIFVCACGDIFETRLDFEFHRFDKQHPDQGVSHQ